MEKSLSDIKESLDSHIGRKLTLKANSGRRKTVEHAGVLAETYPAVFVIELDQESTFDRISFSYADILTSTVELFFLDEQGEKYA